MTLSRARTGDLGGERSRSSRWRFQDDPRPPRPVEIGRAAKVKAVRLEVLRRARRKTDDEGFTQDLTQLGRNTCGNAVLELEDLVGAAVDDLSAEAFSRRHFHQPESSLANHRHVFVRSRNVPKLGPKARSIIIRTLLRFE